MAKPDKTSDNHWLVRPETIRKLWIGGIAILAVTALCDLVVAHHPHFGIDGTFGFAAWFGFVSCVLLVAFAKGLGVFLKRPDTYYEDSQ